MIKNIILDVGMVLVDFCWKDLLGKLNLTDEEYELIADATVLSPKWNEYDRSVMTDEELLAHFKEKAPGCEDKVQEFWDRAPEMIRQFPYAKEWITSLKAAGLRVYILSNYARRTYEMTRTNGLDFLPLADGAVFSFETGYTKPEKEIYHIIMEKYGLKPQECLFIDDNADNLKYPKELGWSTITFHTFAQVQEELQKKI